MEEQQNTESTATEQQKAAEEAIKAAQEAAAAKKAAREAKSDKVEGLWDCPYCGQKGIGGLTKHCPGCGHPQDNNTKFYLATEKKHLTKEQAENYGKGEDWDCPFCGSMNRYDATTCKNCGAPRDQAESTYFTRKQEEPGTQPVAPTAPVSKGPNKKVLIAVGAALLALIAILLVIFLPRKSKSTVTAAQWQRVIYVDQLTNVQESDWTVPSGATVYDEQIEVSGYVQVLDHYEDVEVQRSREVIVGYDEVEPDYKDNGDGTFTEIENTPAPIYDTEYYTETEQQPVYRTDPVLATKYYYTIDRWIYERSVETSGNDTTPVWGEVSLASDEMESGREGVYVLTFSTEKGKTVSVQVPESLFTSYQIGDTASLTTSGGTVTAIDGMAVR